MKKINFTEEHDKRLKELALDLLFGGTFLKGIAGTEYSVFDILHAVTISTVTTMYSNLKKEIEKIESLDEWSMTDYQQKKLSESKKMYEFLNLTIGWRKLQAQRESEKAQIRELKAKLVEVRKSSMSPAEQAKELEDAIKAMGGDPEKDEE